VSGQTVGIVDDIGVTTIAVGSKPFGIAVNTKTNKLYVTNTGSNDISVIDGASNAVVATITDPNAVLPIAVAVNPTTNTIYVANSQSNNVTVIDGASDSITATIAVGTAPSGLDVDSQTNSIYIANAGNSQAGDPGNITVINGATKATQALSDPKAKNPVAVAANPVTNKIYVANSGSNNVTVIDGAHD
jgi:YVTN family beta-propeller protein